MPPQIEDIDVLISLRPKPESLDGTQNIMLRGFAQLLVVC